MRDPVPAFYLLMGTGLGLIVSVSVVALWTVLAVDFPVVVALGALGCCFGLAATVLRRRFQSRLVHKPATEAA